MFLLVLRLIPFRLVLFAFRDQTGFCFAGLIITVFVHFGLGGFGRAAGFFAAGRGGKGCKYYKTSDPDLLHAVKIGVSGHASGEKSIKSGISTHFSRIKFVFNISEGYIYPRFHFIHSH